MLVTRLDILLGTNTTNMSKGFRKGQKEMDSFAAGVARVGKRIAVAATAMTAALTAAAATSAYLIKRQMGVIDQTAKLSDQLGIATEDLIKLRHAADLTGAGADKLDAGLATMSKRLGEAARGSGAATAALKDLGLSATALVAMSPDEQFRTIAAALENVEESAKRNAIAANIFSKANMGLLNTLALGEKGLKATGDEAERLGLTFSRDAARGVEAANDAIDQFQKSITGVFTQGAIQLGPFIKLLADDLTTGIVDAKRVTDELATSTSAAAREFGILGASILTTADAIQEAEKNWLAFQIVWMKTKRFLIGHGEGGTPGWRQSDYDALIKPMEERLAALEGAGDWSRMLAERVRKAQEEMREAAKHATPIIDLDVEGVEEATATVDAAVAKIDDTLSRAQKVFDSTRTPIEEMTAGIDDLNKLLDVGAINLDTYARGFLQLVGAAEKAEQAFQEMQFPGGAEKGSAEAFRILEQHNARGIAQLEATKKARELVARQFGAMPDPNRLGIGAVNALRMGAEPPAGYDVEGFLKRDATAQVTEGEDQMLAKLETIATNTKGVWDEQKRTKAPKVAKF